MAYTCSWKANCRGGVPKERTRPVVPILLVSARSRFWNGILAGVGTAERQLDDNAVLTEDGADATSPRKSARVGRVANDEREEILMAQRQKTIRRLEREERSKVIRDQ